MAGRPPGPRGLPVLGNTVRYGLDPVGFREKCVDKYGDIVSIRVLGMEMYLVSEPSLVKKVLVTDSEAFRIPSFTKEKMEPLLGEGLLMSDGDRWRRARGVVQRGFSSDAVAEYFPVVLEEAERVCDQWNDGEIVDVGASMRETTIRIILRVVFGPEIEPSDHGLVEAVEKIVAPSAPHKQAAFLLVPRWIPLPMNRNFCQGIATIEGFIEERLGVFEGEDADDRSRGALLPLLMRGGNKGNASLSEEEVRDEVMTALVAGHATTAYALTFTWYLLGRNPNKYRHLVDELDSVGPIGGFTEEDAGAPQLELEYADAVLKESLRMFPSANEVRREARYDLELGGYEVSEGTVVATQMWSIHRDSRWYEDPKEFQPSRWENGLEDRLPEFAYFPFGGGERLCVAKQFARMEALLVLAVVSQVFRLEPVNDNDISVTSAVNLKPASAVRMRVRKRPE